jgi:hypothetical protein
MRKPTDRIIKQDVNAIEEATEEASEDGDTPKGSKPSERDIQKSKFDKKMTDVVEEDDVSESEDLTEEEVPKPKPKDPTVSES